jgi:hypothetical protein
MALAGWHSAIKRFPIIHRTSGKARWYFDRYCRHVPLAIKTEFALRRSERIAFDIGGNIGLGALLSHAAYALRTGADRGVDVALRFTSPIYRPASGPHDWLECYFSRNGSRPDTAKAIDSSGLRFDYSIGRDCPLLWSYISIRPELVKSAVDLTGNAPFAAIHYRGSDKFMEARRVKEDHVLCLAEEVMASRGLNRLFVASDEAAFIRKAENRFGTAAFWLPCEAMASGARAAHFSEINGETKAREALVTMVALSRSGVCIRTPSYLSAWAMTLANNVDTIIAS